MVNLNFGRIVACYAIGFGLLAGEGLGAAELDAEQLFDSTRLMNVEIELPEQDWETLRKQSRGRGGNPFSNTSEKPFKYFKGDVTINGVKVSSVGIRKKGFIGSLDETRPSLKVKFSEYVEQQPVKGLDRLTLNNNKQDTALVSQFLSYKIFNDAGVHAPRVSFAKVTVNGDYLGIYSHIESFKKPFLKDRYNDDSGNLYEGTLADFYPKAVAKIEGKTKTKADEDPDVKRLAEILASDEDLPIDEINKLVDLDSFLKYWAVESLLGFWDGYTQNQNNFFVYDNPGDGKFYFMPWGADSCFTKGGGPFNRGGPQTASVRAESMLSNRLFNSKGIPARYKKTLLKVLDDAWHEEKLVAEIDRVEKLTKGQLHANQKPGGRSRGWGGQPLTMDGVRDFVETRREAVLDELENEWPMEVAERPRKPMYTVELGSMAGAISTHWSEDDDADADGSVTDLQFQLEGEEVAMQKTSISAHAMQSRGFGRGRPGWTPPANIVIKGKDSDDESVSLTLMVNEATLKEVQEKPIPVSGFVSFGEQQGFGFGRQSGKMVQGELTLTKSSTTEGEPIEGKFSLRVVEMRGGLMDRFRGRGRGDRGRGRGRERSSRPE